MAKTIIIHQPSRIAPRQAKVLVRKATRIERLSGVKAKKFKAFMAKAMPREGDLAYTREWAHRFRTGFAYAQADLGNRRVLARLGISGKGDKQGYLKDVYKKGEEEMKKTTMKLYRGGRLTPGDLLFRSLRSNRDTFLVDRPPVGRFAGKLTLIPASTSIPGLATRKKLGKMKYIIPR